VRPLAAVLIACTIAAAAAAAVEHGTIVVNRGAGGVTLGMTRAAVVQRLGAPLYQNANGYMQYAKTNLFDVYLNGANRVRMIGVSGARFCTSRGVCMQSKGGVGRLKAQYGKALRLVKAEDGERLYVLVGSFNGRRSFTSFGFAAKGRIIQIFIGWCPAAPATCGA